MKAMEPDPSIPTITKAEFEDLLQLTLENQRIEGIILTEEEIATVWARLRRQYGLA